MYYTVTVTGRLTTGADSVEAIALTVKYPGGDVPTDVCPTYVTGLIYMYL